MKKYLENYKQKYKQQLLNLLWKQWNSLGISGYGEKWSNSVIDLEALLLFSSTVSRYDPRLFDGIIEWVYKYENLINIQRLNNIQNIKNFPNTRIISAIAFKVKNSVNTLKWDKLTKFDEDKVTESENLFFLPDNKPLPVLGEKDKAFLKYKLIRNKYIHQDVVKDALAVNNENLILRLRSFLGLNSRCEIILYLLINNQGSPREIARECYYYPATISKTLNEMSLSSFIVSEVKGRKKSYSFSNDEWVNLLISGNDGLRWINWSNIFKFFEIFWTFLFSEHLNSYNEEQLSSVLRRLILEKMISEINNSGLDDKIHKRLLPLGIDLIPYFIEKMKKIISCLCL
ncbi:MAG: hypothetical protein APR63_09195 [Desulfuromonas sp. SDB]|nr:MAG: hypothetical protein APR63_09195 [Desulfuromonas sp. SDB]